MWPRGTKRIIASTLLIAGAGCATAEPITQTVAPMRAVAQTDIEPVKEYVVGYWGEGGYLVRMGEEEFTVHKPESGEVVSRARVDGRLVHVGVNPLGDMACVVYTGPRGGGHTLALYDANEDDWRWEKRLGGTSKLAVAGEAQCLIAYEGDQNPEVFEAADGEMRSRLFQTPEEPLGVFTSQDGHRQWWFTEVDGQIAEAPVEWAVGGRPTRGDQQQRQAEEPAEEQAERPARDGGRADEPPSDDDIRTTRASGTQWNIHQVDIRGWTLEGTVIASCFEADDVEIRVVPVGDFSQTLSTMGRRSQLRVNEGACVPAGPDEVIRFADGEHRLTRPEQEEAVARRSPDRSGERQMDRDLGAEDDEPRTRRRPDDADGPLSREEARAQERIREAQERGEQARDRVDPRRSGDEEESEEDEPRMRRRGSGSLIQRGADVIREFAD